MPQLTASEELRSSLVETTLLSHIAQSSRENSGELLVRDLLTLKHFHDWRIVGGAQGANRPISSLNLMESPDIANWDSLNTGTDVLHCLVPVLKVAAPRGIRPAAGSC